MEGDEGAPLRKQESRLIPAPGGTHAIRNASFWIPAGAGMTRWVELAREANASVG